MGETMKLTRDRIEEIAREVYRCDRFTPTDEVWCNLHWLTLFAEAVERETLTEKDREIERLKASVQNLKGAMMADDDRLTAAGNRVGLYFGCDTPDAMADEIESLRSQLSASQAREREAVTALAEARERGTARESAIRDGLTETMIEREDLRDRLAAARKALEARIAWERSVAEQCVGLDFYGLGGAFCRGLRLVAESAARAALNGDSHE